MLGTLDKGKSPLFFGIIKIMIVRSESFAADIQVRVINCNLF